MPFFDIVITSEILCSVLLFLSSAEKNKKIPFISSADYSKTDKEISAEFFNIVIVLFILFAFNY